MAGIDPWLYIAFGLGYLAGRLLPWRSPWIGRATLGTIFALVLFLGDELASSSAAALLLTIPLALGLAVLLLALTAGIAWTMRAPLLRPRSPGRVAVPYLGLLFLGALLLGYALGRNTSVPLAPLLTPALYLLLALVAFDLKLTAAGLRRVAIPLTAAIAGAALAALIFSLGTGAGARLTLASSFAFGWYTLAGPLTAERLGATAGLLAFLTNFFRENLTMVLAPAIGPRAGPEVLTAMGGATAMDTTLFFVTEYSDKDAGALALGSGFVLTVCASLVLPLILSLPPP